MKILENNLIDLYRRFINFLTSNFPDALIIENTNNVIIAYPNEPGRILILQEQGTGEDNPSVLIVRMLLDLNAKISFDNSVAFYLSTIDELNCIKPAIQLIMRMKRPSASSSQTSKSEPEQQLIAKSGQGYITDKNKKIIGVVDLSLVPTNAYVRNTDLINSIDADKRVEEKRIEKTIKRFFKR